jgi:hypothetical protein
MLWAVSRAFTAFGRNFDIKFGMVKGALSQEVERPGRKIVHASPASVKDKKTWIYISAPHTSSWRSA